MTEPTNPMTQLLRYVVIVLTALMLLTGCHSSKKSSSYPATEKGTTRTERVTDKREQRRDKAGKVGERAEAIAREALRWVGTPYVFGGTSREGTDCSGMVMTIYERVGGIKLPRNSAKQYEACSGISSSELKTGDLVFFTTSKDRGKINHVGIYVGSGDFVHASTSRGVMVSNLSEKYYEGHFHSARRVPGLHADKAEKEVKKGQVPPARRSIRRYSKRQKIALPQAVRKEDLPQRVRVPYIPPTIIFEEPEDEPEEDDIRGEVRRAMMF